MNEIIVTRHAATVEWLREMGIEAEVKSQVDVEDVQGKVVIGNIPFHLACETKEVYVVGFNNLPEGVRGYELSLEDMKRYGAFLQRYQVIKV